MVVMIFSASQPTDKSTQKSQKRKKPALAINKPMRVDFVMEQPDIRLFTTLLRLILSWLRLQLDIILNTHTLDQVKLFFQNINMMFFTGQNCSK